MRLEETVQTLRTQLAESQQKAGQERDDLVRILEQKHRCEVLYAEGRTIDAAMSLLVIANAVGENLEPNRFIAHWLAGEFWHYTSE